MEPKKRQKLLKLTPSSPKSSRQWKSNKRWNPFNSYKLIAHVGTWKHIKRGRKIPAPILVTVDPTNLCNLDCAWCNARFIRKQRQRSLSGKILNEISDYLSKWKYDSGIKPGVQAVCIAGGGEPLLNPHTGEFIDRLIHNQIEVGVVTNGVLIDNFIDSLAQSTWVGVSVDAGSDKIFHKYKERSKHQFERVMENIALLNDYARKHYTRLGQPHPAYGVSYKYLLYEDNIGEIYEAAKIAKEIGCKNIHFRPAGTTWDDLGTEREIRFTREQIELFNEQIALTMELDDDSFGVYGITHKFNNQFQRSNSFENCHAIFMTAVIEPPACEDEVSKDAFVLGLCCDRRGDTKLELGTNLTDVNQITKLWGGRRHWAIFDAIRVNEECPRCTYQPHNEIYENVILNDSMTYKFI
ncbi:MAG: radical SAM protein [Desulfobacteraceae bacterium]|nr:radical SAM protein [Desulfobacteraceae bacterium]